MRTRCNIIVFRFNMSGSPSIYHCQNQNQLSIGIKWDFFRLLSEKNEMFGEIVSKQSKMIWKGKCIYKIVSIF